MCTSNCCIDYVTYAHIFARIVLQIVLHHKFLVPFWTPYQIDNGWMRKRYRGIMTEAKTEVVMPITPDDLPIIYFNVESQSQQELLFVAPTASAIIHSATEQFSVAAKSTQCL